jgi:trehalose-phosphatase
MHGGFSLARTDIRGGSRFDASDVVAAEIGARSSDRHVLVLTDFDGTLAELAPTPAEAVMTSEVRAEFDRLSALDSVTVGVVSGRRLVDVRARVGPAAEFVAGLHGLEIVGPWDTFTHPVLETVTPLIAELCRAAARALAWCPGLLLEDKTYALTCHVRQVAPEAASRALQEFVELAEPQLEAGVLKLLPGAQAYELLPATDWNKGGAVGWIRANVAQRRGEAPLVIYLGDDRTDEDAFTALVDGDVAIGVGERPHTHLVDWRLAGPASAGRFFARLANLMEPRDHERRRLRDSGSGSSSGLVS